MVLAIFRHWWAWVILILVALIAGAGGYVFGLVGKYFDAIDKGQISIEQAGFTQLPTAPQDVSTKNGIALVRANNPRFGNDSAKLTVVEFSDFQCPFSREMFPTVRALMNEYSDRVQFVYRHMPIVELHPLAVISAKGAECAADQGKFWEYHDALFLNQDTLNSVGTDLDGAKRVLNSLAQRVHLDERTFSACLESTKGDEYIQTDYNDGAALGVRGTPTFFFNGVQAEGVIPETDFKEIIEQFIK